MKLNQGFLFPLEHERQVSLFTLKRDQSFDSHIDELPFCQLICIEEFVYIT